MMLVTRSRFFSHMGTTLLLGAMAGAAAAQDQPAAFVHGLNSGSAAWQSTASQLAAEFQIQPILPDLPWSQPFAYQASSLNAALSAVSPGSITVGHSNGGLVSRFYNRDFGALNTHIASVGTPHLGAPLASTALNGMAAQSFSAVLGVVSEPLLYYGHWEAMALNDSPWQVVAHAFWGLGDFLESASDALAAIGYASPVVGQAYFPVLDEMIPGPSLP